MRLISWLAVLVFSICMVVPLQTVGETAGPASMGAWNTVEYGYTICPTCRGEKVCRSCGGTGIVSGSLACPECHGRGPVQLAEDPGLLVLIDKHNKAAVQKCSAAFGF